jgi:hypothetical protein
MKTEIFLYIAAILSIFWGVAHLIPTKSVVKGFGDISKDNIRIITMEWISEGIALIFIGALVFFITFLDHQSSISKAVYWISFVALNAFSVVSLFTGFKINFLPFKLCPFIFTGSSILILLGIVL